MVLCCASEPSYIQSVLARCREGETFSNNCYRCVCLKTGWICTGNMCGHAIIAFRPLPDGTPSAELDVFDVVGDSPQPGSVRVVRSVPKRRPSTGGPRRMPRLNPCTPGETRRASDCCNTCTCTDAGYFQCTRRWCYVPGCRRNRVLSRRSVDEFRDVVTRVVQKDTHDDVIDSDDVIKREKRAAPFRRVRPVSNDLQLECTTGQTMNDGCNVCGCFGGMWRCTMRACF